MSDSTYIDLLRHGACEGGNIFRGRCDVELSVEGLQQMQRATAAPDVSWQLVVSSPLKRCAAFSEALARSHSVELVLDERLRELDFGDWDGLEIAQVWRDDNTRISAWSRDPSASAPPGGESLAALASRVKTCLDDLLGRYRGHRLLLVTHGGVIRVLLSQVLGMPLAYANRFEVPYACLSRLAVYHSDEGDSIKLLGHNWTLVTPGNA